MNRFLSKMIAILLAVTFVVGILPVTTVYAAEEETPLFSVGSKTNLTFEQALTAAGKSGTIIMTKSGTLVGGPYTIPSGVTLLLPYESGANTVNDSRNSLPYANSTADSSTNKICLPDEKVYMDLSLSDVQLSVQGKLVVGGRYSSAGGLSGQTSGSHSNIRLDQDSSIVVVKNGILSCNGYILGEGTVTVENGGSMYEPFLIVDYGGGTYTAGAYHGGNYTGGTVGNTGNSLMPFNIYSMQNVQSNVSLKSGASVFGYCDLYTGTPQKHNVTTAKIVGSSNALINLKNGEINVSFNPNKFEKYREYLGRTEIVVDGDVYIGSMSMTIDVILFSLEVRSSSVNFPIPYNISYTQNSGTVSIPEGVSLKVLPGAEITIKDAAKMQVEGKFLVYDGMDDRFISNNASYPSGSELSNQNRFSERGRLIVDGDLTITGTFAGKVETNSFGKIVTSSNAILSEDVYDGVESNWGVSFIINSSIGTTTRVMYPLVAQIVDHTLKYETETERCVSMKKNMTYFGVSGEKIQNDVFYKHVVNPSGGGALTNAQYIHPISLVGSWNENAVLFDNGSQISEVDPEFNCLPGKVVRKYSDSSMSQEINVNPERGVVYYQFVDCNHAGSEHTSYNPIENGHSYICTVCDGTVEDVHEFGDVFDMIKDGHVYTCICGATKTDVHDWGEDGNCRVTGCDWSVLQINADEDEIVLSNMDLSGQIVIAACYEVIGDQQGRMVSCDIAGEKLDSHDYYVFKLNGLEKDMKVTLFFLDENYCPAEQGQIKQIAS